MSFFKVLNILFVVLTSFYISCSAFEFKEGNKLNNNFFIITGGPGTGKTTLIEELRRRGICCIEEGARKIIQDEMASGGDALPWKNIKKCIELMIARSIDAYYEAVNAGENVVIFDRGVLDYLGFAYRTQTPISHELENTAKSLLYNKMVFIAPPWEEIYCNDAERKQTFEEALEVYDSCVKIYSENGYEVIEIPKATINERAEFLIKHIKVAD